MAFSKAELFGRLALPFLLVIMLHQFLLFDLHLLTNSFFPLVVIA